jgi:hypothetical protein
MTWRSTSASVGVWKAAERVNCGTRSSAGDGCGSRSKCSGRISPSQESGAPCRGAGAHELGPVAEAGVRDRPGTLPPMWRPLEDHRRPFDRLRTGIEAPPIIAQILTHLGLPARAPPRSPMRSFDRFQMARSQRTTPSHPIPLPEPTTSFGRHPPERPKRSRIRGLRMAEGPETSRILDRRLASLTTHSSIRTLPLAEKERLKFLFASEHEVWSADRQVIRCI